MNGENGEFKEFQGLADRLARADFSGESRVKDVLRESLLERSDRPARRRVVAWLVPAAVVMAAALFMVNVRQRPVPGARASSAAAGYNLPGDGYGECGREGLPNYTAEERF
jgi:hypothetical protein